MITPDRYAALPLALGPLSPEDAHELQALKQLIRGAAGFHCESYKESCLRRRIAVRMRACGVHTYGDYARALEADPQEQRRLLDAITVNVSKFYRNPSLWDALWTEVLPRLFDRRQRRVRIWSAGCAAGEEPYTMAMVLKEYGRQAGLSVSKQRFQIIGSDIDEDSLQRARTGRYGSFSFTDIPERLRQEWFIPPEHVQVRPELRELVRFEYRDLIRGDFEPDQQLILCRNVIIYLERAMQEELFRKFHEALAPGGILVLGKVETLLGRAASLFRALAPRERVFIRV